MERLLAQDRYHNPRRPPISPSRSTCRRLPPSRPRTLVKTKKVEEMSFAEWQMVLSEGTPEDAEKVWTALKGKPLQMVAHIISIDASGKAKVDPGGQFGRYRCQAGDIDLTMSAAIPKKDMPKEDTDFQFEGTPVSYVAKPFVMTMNDGALLVKAAPKPGAHHKKAQ
jgi:hypothetical protein